MFIVIVASVIKQRQANRSQSTSKRYRENLVIALSLAVVFGLGWGFGLLATSFPVEELTITFQVLFSIFVGAQGALLFLLHGVRNADARRVWKRWATSFTSTTKTSSIVSSSKKGVMNTQPLATFSRTTGGSTLQLQRTMPHNVLQETDHAFETKIDLSVSATVSKMDPEDTEMVEDIHQNPDKDQMVADKCMEGVVETKIELSESAIASK